MEVFSTPALPAHWVVRDDNGEQWIVPAHNSGWSKKRPYRGNYTLETALSYMPPAIRKQLYGIPA